MNLSGYVYMKDDKVWWFCHRCRYNWKGKMPSERLKLAYCTRCRNYPVVPGYDNKKWSQIRNEILKRDGYKCMMCGSKERLEIHHIIPV
ncbi:hypothetical protein DRQ09_02640 [candidate division KSB1 bacterium]|nr:MAG: hypothetical protein DRQ09_02640 [candidate division KSB1 bacterium]